MYDFFSRGHSKRFRVTLNDLVFHEFLKLTRQSTSPSNIHDIIDSISIRDSYFLFVPRSCHVDQFTFHIQDDHITK